MIHARKDYARFQDPALDDPGLLTPGSTPIAADEPVFLLRAQDEHFVDMLEHYHQRLMENGGAPEMIDAVDDHVMLAEAWQRAHGTKKPDMPTDDDNAPANVAELKNLLGHMLSVTQSPDFGADVPAAGTTALPWPLCETTPDDVPTCDLCGDATYAPVLDNPHAGLLPIYRVGSYRLCAACLDSDDGQEIQQELKR